MSVQTRPVGWVFGGGLVGLLMSVLIYLGDYDWFPREKPLASIALVVLGLQVGALIQRRRAPRDVST